MQSAWFCQSVLTPCGAKLERGICKWSKEMVDLVGIEPTTSSMPCKKHSSRRLVFKQLATGTSGRNGVFGAISGQFPANVVQQKPESGLHGRRGLIASRASCRLSTSHVH